jgi:hypothetical protein
MGSGHYSDNDYHSRKSQRVAQGVDDFQYSKTNTTIHPNLDPKRIKGKPFHKLESRDNPDHPNSNAVVVTFDVTGSNIENARIVQSKLPTLMGLLGKYLPDPQVCIAANDDILAVGQNSVQISEFESDIRIDESIRNLLLTGQGGGNDGESYDLMLYGIARKTVLDCYEKRKRLGYCFIYADEPMRLKIFRNDILTIYGERIEADIPLAQIVKELQQQYNVWVLWPSNSTYEHSREQYKSIFGVDRVITLESPSFICELIGLIIGMTESKLSQKTAVHDLVTFGSTPAEAAKLVEGVVSSTRLLTGAAAD